MEIISSIHFRRKDHFAQLWDEYSLSAWLLLLWLYLFSHLQVVKNASQLETLC
jgi:hypothetical protein